MERKRMERKSETEVRFVERMRSCLATQRMSSTVAFFLLLLFINVMLKVFGKERFCLVKTVTCVLCECQRLAAQQLHVFNSVSVVSHPGCIYTFVPSDPIIGARSSVNLTRIKFLIIISNPVQCL